ncbi:indole-3-glycerol-phosphate synthase [Streptosporangium sp. NPDC051023]|uniref:indole-3-glycerol-phosphate synthase n=1 Tax=Streptosporangium sp. NPDC051023 TaxID=3155410 RepID=UPI00344EA4E0
MSSRFIESLLAADRRLIMEVKRRDPHGADLFGGRLIAEVVAEYEAAGAPCISVVTGRWFGGDHALLREVAELTDRPLLQKDFITRVDQVHTAKLLGASAVLLTAALLPRSSMRNLVGACLSVGLTPFVEVTEEKEIDGVPDADQCVIAVNNKDITIGERDTGDIERGVRLLPALKRSGTRCPVSASGIDQPRVAARLLDAGFAGLLIGTSLLRAGNVRAWAEKVDGLRGRQTARRRG